MEGGGMSGQRSREQRRLLRLLGLFLALMLAAGAALSLLHGRQLVQLSHRREAAIASYLLEQGLPREQLIQALCCAESSARGEALLADMGHGAQARARFLPWTAGAQMGFTALTLGLLGILGLLPLLAELKALDCREKLYQAAAEITEGYARGDMNRRLPWEPEGGIYRLLSAVDALALALQARAESEGRSRAFLKDMISDISHQLKTPLAAINMYTDIMAAEPARPETVRRFTEKTLQQLGKMERLIQLLLKTARLDCGAVTFAPEDCRVTALLERACAGLEERAEREGKQLCREGDRQAVLYCDPVWTAEALGNLVKNALDHTEAGGRIDLRWEQGPCAFRLRVLDDGTGLAQEDIYHIFKRFYRSKGSPTEGAGLGLPLAKAVAEGQGGSISAGNREGGGAEFILSFPYHNEKFTGM